MPLTSTSTFDEVYAAYIANLNYTTVAEAREFRVACHMMLTKFPVESGDRMTNARFDLQAIKDELKRVNDWLVSNDDSLQSSTPKVIYPDMSQCRG